MKEMPLSQENKPSGHMYIKGERTFYENILTINNGVGKAKGYEIDEDQLQAARRKVALTIKG